MDINGDYREAKDLYTEKACQVKYLLKFIYQLKKNIFHRQAKFKMMRRYLALRCNLYFQTFLTKINCSGAINFDHHSETLSISINAPGEGSGSRSDMRLLSAGEHSFTTICFMLSLWKITESPFRCFDEFDVYMDMNNQETCLRLLLELLQEEHYHQFIFVTPLTTSNLPQSSLIKIHHLLGPRTVQSRTEDEDV